MSAIRHLYASDGIAVDTSRLADQPLNSGVARFPIDFRSLERRLREHAERSSGWLRHWLPRRRLRLELDDRVLAFDGIAEFEFALAGRTEFPVHRIGELLPMAPVELKRLATNIRQVEKRLADVLAASLDEPGAIGRLLARVDEKQFSQDHGWRRLFAALAGSGEHYDDFKKLALIKYMQYLGARQEVLRSLYLEKKYQRGAASAAPRFDPLATCAVEPAECRPPHETSLFDDMTGCLAESPEDADLCALPRGETICVNLGEHGEMPLALSRQHRFRLLSDTPMTLVDPGGMRFRLAEGRNVVGRHGGNHVVLDTGYQSISRRHLVIEPLGASMALLTDLSAHGSFVPADRLPETPRPAG